MIIDWDEVHTHEMHPEPQVFHHRADLPDLTEAASDLTDNFFSDSRDWPGTLEDGRSPLARHHNSHDTPQPTYDPETVEGATITRGRAGYPPWMDKTHQFIRAAQTPMSYSAAIAYTFLLQYDPTHPFVTSHIADGVTLNNAASYFMVNGPALAIPLNERTPEPPNRTGGDTRAPMPPRGWEARVADLSGYTGLHVQANNPYGLSDEDFVAAADRHPDLSDRQIVTAHRALTDITAVRADTHEKQQEQLTPTLAYEAIVDGQAVGYYNTETEALRALTETLDADIQPNYHLGSGFGFSNAFQRSYSIEPCFIADGKRVPAINSGTIRYTEATGTVHTTIETVPYRSTKTPVGWLFVWTPRDWHRNPAVRTYFFNQNRGVLGSRAGQLPYPY